MTQAVGKLPRSNFFNYEDAKNDNWISTENWNFRCDDEWVAWIEPYSVRMVHKVAALRLRRDSGWLSSEMKTIGEISIKYICLLVPVYE